MARRVGITIESIIRYMQTQPDYIEAVKKVRAGWNVPPIAILPTTLDDSEGELYFLGVIVGITVQLERNKKKRKPRKSA